MEPDSLPICCSTSADPPALLTRQTHRSFFARHVLLFPRFQHVPLQLARSSSTSTNTGDSITSTISNAASYVTETIKEYTAGASKEANKVSHAFPHELKHSQFLFLARVKRLEPTY